MCFSNLPIEFDDEGNPYLAEEADEVDRTPASEAESASSCGCTDGTDDVALDDADPEALYEEIVETMPSDIHERLTDSSERPVRAAEPERPNSGRTD
jgi:hypothetical protein